ncbi:ipa protein [Macroventuria anomochaeta]|uniref:Ipa protein n=1 Tax=Macroventuria anomochaeta TaxID=301207 RepID=A0ACB6SIQ4_9PLEO|nr:ipa protein [Macroventuria anomochaeta]KAF2633278.1 ipa protein [Macroventuria anomochaeta]
MNETVRNLHHDLVRKFERHGSRIEQMWRSLGQEEREKILRDASIDRSVLKDPHDTSLGNVCRVIPEWNLRDLTPPSSDILLDILKYRATTPLTEQYISGVNGAPGDYENIVDSMQRNGFRLSDASTYKDCYTLFLDDEQYGQSYKITPGNKDDVLTNMKPAIEAGLIIPQDIGELVLMRQNYLLQLLNIIVEDIFDTASTTRSKTTRPTRTSDVATAALATLSFHSPPKKLGIPDLVDSSQEQKSSWEDYINLISTEPTVLSHEVNLWFFTRPELVGDEKGRSMPVHTDRYISGAVLDAVHGVVKATATWNYISQLLALLDSSPDRRFRVMVLQELSNTCYLELTRAQVLFTRSVSVFSGGNRWFERKSTVRKDGIVRVSMKRNPESLMLENPQLYYMLRLCQEGLDWSGSVQWLQKLEDFHRAHPLEKDKMAEREFSSLGDLAVIVTFLQSLSQVEQLPAANKKQKHSFLLKVSDLETTIGQLKEELDLDDFVIPMGNLLEPGMASGALVSLDHHVHEKMGTKLGFLYEQLVDDSVANLHKRYHESKVKASNTKTGYLVPTIPEASESSIHRRREKEKTRPAHSFAYAIVPEAAGFPSSSARPAPPQPRFKVKATTFNVFSLLLSRSSAARGSISWDAFVAAMTDVGFSVTPKVGSIYTFVPPENMVVRRNCTLHRPHKSCIEGVVLLIYSCRLKRVYEWDESTFILV